MSATHGRRNWRDGGYVPQFEILGVPLEITTFTKYFKIFANFLDFTMFPKRRSKIPRRNRNFGVGGFDSSESVPQSESIPLVETSWQRPWR